MRKKKGNKIHSPRCDNFASLEDIEKDNASLIATPTRHAKKNIALSTPDTGGRWYRIGDLVKTCRTLHCASSNCAHLELPKGLLRVSSDSPLWFVNTLTSSL